MQNFPIGREKMPGEIIASLALLKKVCARVNFSLGLLEEEQAALERRREEIRQAVERLLLSKE